MKGIEDAATRSRGPHIAKVELLPQVKHMIKRLDLILNGKGGVGKSFFAVNFVQYLKDRNIEYSACDCDNENSTLKRFHAEVEFNLADRRALRPDFSFAGKGRSCRRGLPGSLNRGVFQLF